MIDVGVRGFSAGDFQFRARRRGARLEAADHSLAKALKILDALRSHLVTRRGVRGHDIRRVPPLVMMPCTRSVAMMC